MPACTHCRYCDKESVLVSRDPWQWVKNGEGYCTAENSVVNGTIWYQRIGNLNTPRECVEFTPTQPTK